METSRVSADLAILCSMVNFTKSDPLVKFRVVVVSRLMVCLDLGERSRLKIRTYERVKIVLCTD